MPILLFNAPAGAGKTSYILEQARHAAASLAHEVRICVPTHLQAQAIRSRLAHLGGAIGVHVLTFDRLVADCLDATHTAVTELSEPVQYRLLQAIITTLPLAHYHSLIDKPGFIQVLQQLIAEWKSARVEPAALHLAFQEMGSESRLVELADIYAAYQGHLQAHGWVDRVGRYWVAVEALNQQPNTATNWAYLFVDGFDDFTPIQLALMKVLSERVGEMVITLTGDGETANLYPRFAYTQTEVETVLDVSAQSLPYVLTASSTLHQLAGHVFQPGIKTRLAPGSTLTLLEAPDIARETRQALRWVKTHIIQDGYSPGQVALLARDIAPYRPFIRQAAQEMGLPLRLADGLPLLQSPVIVALLDLLCLFLPDSQHQPSLPRQSVISAWRSPYFNWDTCSVTLDGPVIGMQEGDAERLDAAARFGRVLGGLDQWQEAFALLISYREAKDEAEDEERQQRPPRNTPTGEHARRLQTTFDRFCQRLTPPEAGTFREYVCWLETLIGPDPALDGPYPRPAPTSLSIVTRVRANPMTEANDLAALQVFKEILRGLVWAEDALAGSASLIPITYDQFLAELLSAVQANTYRLPLLSGQPAILVATIPQARGLSFSAVAILGFGEGSFPQPIREDPFLRDSDRAILRRRFGFPLDLSTLSAEREFFYETLTHAREQMLLLRPRLADTGAEWVASPFWQAIRQLTGMIPLQLNDDPLGAASWSEWLTILAQHPPLQQREALDWLAQHNPDLATSWHIATELFQARLSGEATHFDGDLSQYRETLTQIYGPDHVWSTSRLEQVQTCGHFFFVNNLLFLDAHPEPALGLDVRQLGSLYHALFEQVYNDPANIPHPESVELVPFVTALAQPILAKAPQRYGFREAAWWSHTQNKIIADVIFSIRQLAVEQNGFTPVALEERFGLPDNPLVIPAPQGTDDRLQVRGVVDRIDRNPAGEIRVIDYKLGGPANFTNKELERGRKLQLPFYALAMQEALSHGPAVDGFYWHVTKRESSKLTLATYEGGIESAIATAINHAWSAVNQARGGDYRPAPPPEGCPDYCPAQVYCWHYKPKSWG